MLAFILAAGLIVVTTTAIPDQRHFQQLQVKSGAFTTTGNFYGISSVVGCAGIHQGNTNAFTYTQANGLCQLGTFDREYTNDAESDISIFGGIF